MTSYYLNKFEQDILKAYQTCYGEIDRSDKKSVLKACTVGADILYELCHSYYNRDKYSHVKKIERIDAQGDNYPAIASLFKSLSKEDILSRGNDVNHYFLVNSLFNTELEDKKFVRTEFSNRIEQDTDCAKVKELLKKDSFYALLLEDNPVKRLLNLKEKDNLQLTTFEQGISFERLTSLMKEQTIDNNDNLAEYCRLNCGLEFINHKTQKNDTWFILHNQTEIAGIALLKNNFFLSSVQEADRFKYLGYITVGFEFRGQGFGSLLSNEVMKYCEQKGFVYERSQPTVDGKAFLKDRIDKSMESYPSLSVIKSEYAREIREYIKKNFIEGCDTEKCLIDLKEKIQQINTAEHLKPSQLKSILKKNIARAKIT